MASLPIFRRVASIFARGDGSAYMSPRLSEYSATMTQQGFFD